MSAVYSCYKAVVNAPRGFICQLNFVSYKQGIISTRHEI